VGIELGAALEGGSDDQSGFVIDTGLGEVLTHPGDKVCTHGGDRR
jgi:hypothetical protein